MGCGSCGTKQGGLPAGCKDHGSCRSGGCNRLNTHDWLSLIPVSDFSKPFPFIEVSFNHGSRKDYFRIQHPHTLEKGDYVTVEGNPGIDVGVVSLTGELVKLNMKKKGVSEKSEEIRKVLRASTEEEINRMHEVKKGERDMMIQSRVIARDLNLDMKIAEVEIQADGKKATFFYTAEDRVDFRELIKRYANDFRVRIDMRQIGIRQEAAKVGGIGSCGRELCCSTWLNEFKSVSTTAARYQNLSINQTKLSGQCGRLKCCLNYELDTYMDALRVFPDQADKIRTTMGTAYLQKKDIFRNLMWYSYEKSNTLYPLTIERVKEILTLNSQGVFPDELQAVEVVKKTAIADKEDFVDVVGQLSLKSLEKKKKKKKSGQKPASSASDTNTRTENGQNAKSDKPKTQAQAPKKNTADRNNRPQQTQANRTEGPKTQPQNQKPAANPERNNPNQSATGKSNSGPAATGGTEARPETSRPPLRNKPKGKPKGR